MEIEVSKEAAEQFLRIPKPFRRNIQKKIDLLAANGFNLNSIKALAGEHSGCYRLRSGVYRIIFRVEDDTAKISAIKHRKDAYTGD